MNVTPLIDVLLVLLIIFMVIQPTTPKGLDTVVPQPPKDKTTQPSETTIVVQVLNTGAVPTYKINQTTYPADQMASELTKIFEIRQEKIMFIKGDPTLNFGAVADAIGFGKAADVTNIAIITPGVENGS